LFANLAAAQTLKVSGFSTPESVIHDTIQDIYFVSNVGPGNAGALDGNGFISRVSPSGTILQLAWVSGLNGPKGLWLFGDGLYVADVDTLRVFNRFTGGSITAIPIPNPLAQPLFLNDVVVAQDGTAFITDNVNSAIFLVTPQGQPSLLASGAALGRPNGIQAQGANISWVTFFSNTVLRTNPSTHIFTQITLPPVDVSQAGLPPGALLLDGYIQLQDGRVLVSSWVTGDVSFISPSGKEMTTVAHVPSLFDPSGPAGPADINVDLSRGRVLIPLFNLGQLLIVPLPTN
jgi:sugar lactone lactonase YvrE